MEDARLDVAFNVPVVLPVLHQRRPFPTSPCTSTLQEQHGAGKIARLIGLHSVEEGEIGGRGGTLNSIARDWLSEIPY